jgi:hypothetical protein
LTSVTATLDHVAPELVDISVVYVVMADPPVVKGRTHDKYAVVPAKKPSKKRGSDDTVAAIGVAPTSEEAWRVPTELTA